MWKFVKEKEYDIVKAWKMKLGCAFFEKLKIIQGVKFY